MDDAEQDAEIDRLIEQADASIFRYCGRGWGKPTLEEELAALTDLVPCDECGEEGPRNSMCHAHEETRSRVTDRYLCGDCTP